ncbi:MAG: hypothetical protein H0U01_02760 [Acidimicrobiia bacterium]|nr:hypothetical protein [Acidimicrobiia bacterium]
MIELGCDETAPGRSFTAPRNSAADLRMMNRMVRWLRVHVMEVVADQPDAVADDRRVLDDAGSLHRVVLPDLRSVGCGADLAGVGFFGQARTDVDHTPICDLEQQLISAMGDGDGLVAYYNLHRPSEGWSNLVLFTDAEHEHAWGHDTVHREAVHRASTHYRSIRLHYGLLPGGWAGTAPMRLDRTTYLDYRDSQTWRAGRDAG